MDMTRTQWFCCKEQPPVHKGLYEIKLKACKFPKGTVLPIKQIQFNPEVKGGEWDGYYGFMGWYEWRGLAVNPSQVEKIKTNVVAERMAFYKLTGKIK